VSKKHLSPSVLLPSTSSGNGRPPVAEIGGATLLASRYQFGRLFCVLSCSKSANYRSKARFFYTPALKTFTFPFFCEKFAFRAEIIYLDTCCWSRPSDKKVDEKIRREAKAINIILSLALEYGYTVLGSAVLVRELVKTKPYKKLAQIGNLYRTSVTKPATYNKELFKMLNVQAKKAGVVGEDIVHLCYAEASGADYLLTVDNDFITAVATMKINVKVINPTNLYFGGM
jgi:predicted nucleic acid-binding protein